MEQNKNNNKHFMPLLINSLKGKRNWFLLSTVIIFLTTLLIPYILRADEEFFILFGIVETFIIVFLNCLVDNSFLHNDSRLTYYKSKPVSLKEQIIINIVTNYIFAAFLLILIALSVAFQGLDFKVLESFKSIIPWLAAGILLASLSSILCGNTLMAGAMTIFNFALPAIFYLIIEFVFKILENAVVGFSANVLMDYFVNTFYKLDYIYFFRYSNNSTDIDIVYILLLGCILLGITLLTFKCLKKRKNENTGSFIVFDGYKYFVSVLASMIVPAAFSVMSYRNSIGSKITVSFIMAILTYYIIIAVIEKSFKISKLSVKIFVVSIAAFIAVTGGTVAFANQYKSVVPNAEDVKMAYVGNNSFVFNVVDIDIKNINPDEIESGEDFLSLPKNNGIIIFKEKQSIENIIRLHKELLAEQNYSLDYYYSGNMVICYWMKDGSIIVRDYSLNGTDDMSGNNKKDEIAADILNSVEMKERKYYYLYNEKYYMNNYSNIYAYVGYEGSDRIITENINVDEIRPYIIKDLDNQYYNVANAFQALTSYNYDVPKDKENGRSNYYIQIVERNNDKDESSDDYIGLINLNEDFPNTLEYLKPFIDEQ